MSFIKLLSSRVLFEREKSKHTSGILLCDIKQQRTDSLILVIDVHIEIRNSIRSVGEKTNHCARRFIQYQEHVIVRNDLFFKSPKLVFQWMRIDYSNALLEACTPHANQLRPIVRGVFDYCSLVHQDVFFPAINLLVTS